MFRKKIITFILSILFWSPAFGNAFFDKGCQDAVALYIGQSIGILSMPEVFTPHKWEFERMTMVGFQYSQPGTFFRLPMRQNLNIVNNIDYSRNPSGKSFVMAGISWDAAIVDWRGFYFGLGIGPYYRDLKDSRVGSRMMFGEKIFMGYKIEKNTALEFFFQHFSNGDFAEPNLGFNYIGLAGVFNF